MGNEKIIKKYSSSSLKLFEQCPLRYRYYYIDHLPRRTWDHNVLGTMAHSVLEYFHKEYKEGDVLYELMGRCFKKARGEHKKIKRRQLIEVKDILQKYLYKMEKEGMPEGVIGLEERFTFSLDNKYKFNGIIDRVDKVNGEYFIWDYKTSKRMEYMDDFQLSIYALAYFEKHKELERVIAGYIMLRHNSTIIDYEFTREGLEKRKKELVKTCETILSEEEWIKKPGPLCNWCDYYTRFGGPCSGSRKSKEWTVDI